ncbi:MAG: hypothetical protein N2205_06055 [Candidatus Caldatribacterium sp.]|uniref:hypothetical protein n=1 Tax=Candidatus Caldatribacterium sp. TaxID=2282143 RepID=UPI002990D73A|nr:hypothetical protein [Candidatus Caldatribacterium sp.]MCX7730760.1 hypothetical protein [Candidatus Caldatribacterium sp.]MDW8081174.1 hypothetical protein [Candidatus Calescibacterium sp.]
MEKIAFVVFVVLLVLAYLVPFVFLSEVARFSGSFLFWTIFAGGAVAILSLLMRSWNG